MAEPFPVPWDVDRIEVALEDVASRAYPPPVFVAVTALVVDVLEKDPVAAYAATGAMTVPAANAARGTMILRARRIRRTRADGLKLVMGAPE
jgi:formate-dependent phosphoribosylglycinamide formyltransferase (GAR transformylase)